MTSIATPPYVNKASTFAYDSAGTIPTAKTTMFTLADIPTNLGSKTVEFTHLVVDFNYTKGNLTSCDFIVEYGDTSADLYQEQTETTSSGTSTMYDRIHRMSGNTQKGTVSFPITHPVMRVSVLGTGTATTSSLTAKARLIYKP